MIKYPVHLLDPSPFHYDPQLLEKKKMVAERKDAAFHFLLICACSGRNGGGARVEPESKICVIVLFCFPLRKIRGCCFQSFTSLFCSFNAFLPTGWPQNAQRDHRQEVPNTPALHKTRQNQDLKDYLQTNVGFVIYYYSLNFGIWLKCLIRLTISCWREQFQRSVLSVVICRWSSSRIPLGSQWICTCENCHNC